MSADSPKRSSSHSRGLTSVVVSPQQVNDRTILDSVAGFINEVATYNIQNDCKDQIQWVKFEQLEHDEGAFIENFDSDKVHHPPLILVLGYTNGIQVWAVPITGEATEIFSWRHGSVRVLRFLPQPYTIGRNAQSDLYGTKRPIIALCDNAAPGPHYCSLSFLSLKTGEQVKIIKFKNPIVDVLANQRSVVVAFSERIAVFDAFTLEDRLTVTTCYLSPGIHPNPIALGTRWMAYAEKKLISIKRSSGGNEGEGVQSYTATVIHAAKTLGKGLRELGETVASSLTGNAPYKASNSSSNTASSGSPHSETVHKGVVTILDIENQNVENGSLQAEGVVAHFVAHSEAIVCMSFDPSGLLLLTVDKQGHDFHLFRIHPHPGGPALAAVHHLYVLHRGDTTARVQNVSFSPDSRWVAVSTLRGTTHVFPITPYGGNIGVRTHASPHVVNKMSRFHRSAGLNVEGRSHSPVSLFEAPVNSNLPYNNPRLPPYPHPTVVHPLAQIRQPLFIQSAGNAQQRHHAAGRQRLGSSSEDNIQVALRVCTTFAPPRAWFENLMQPPDVALSKLQIKPVESLFVVSCYGTLIQYDLDPHHLFSVPKEKVCDETPIELNVVAKAQWTLQRQPNFKDKPLPLSWDSFDLISQKIPLYKKSKPVYSEDQWLSQVEIVTHAGPHRRLWMGPQFTFKTYNTHNGSPLSINEAQTVDVGRSKPVNMPLSATYPVVIESGSASSCEQSPKLFESHHSHPENKNVSGDMQLKEDLADAMLESPGSREMGGRCVIVSMKPPHSSGVVKVVNPLGTVVTLQSDEEIEVAPPEDAEIHENCDEALFRPVVTPKLTINDDFPFFKDVVDKGGKISRSSDSSKKKTRTGDEHKKNVLSEETMKEMKVKGSNKKKSQLEKAKEKGLVESFSESDDNKREHDIVTKHKRKEKYEKKIEKPFDDDSGKGRSNLNVSITIGQEKKNRNAQLKPSFETVFDENKFKESSETSSSLSEVVEIEKISKLKGKSTLTDNDNRIHPTEFEKIEPVEEKNLISVNNLLDIDADTEKHFDDFVSKRHFEKHVEQKHDTILDINFNDSNQKHSENEAKKREKYNLGKYQGLEINEIVFSSEEEEKKKIEEKQEKTNVKKPRKPKTKLGVRLGKTKDTTETDGDNLKKQNQEFPMLGSLVDDEKIEKGIKETFTDTPKGFTQNIDADVEVTITLPKRSWSSIVSAKAEEKPVLGTLELPDIENVEHIVRDLPKISKGDCDLLESNEQEDAWSSCAVLSKKNSNESKSIKPNKLSDDERSFTETTESDDSGKVPSDLQECKETESSSPEEGKTATHTKSRSSRRKTKNKRR